MDNQIPNIPDDSANNQTPENDIFKEGLSEEAPTVEDTEEKKDFGEETSSDEKRTYADPNSGFGQNTDAYQNMGGYGDGRQKSYGNPGTGQNENPYQSGYQNYNQNGPAYGNTQYQQPNYGGNPNAGYQQNYNGNPNGGYNPNPNGGYQSNYIGVPGTGYQQNYSNHPNSPYDGMDTSPLTMGDWLLTLLACMIPCAGTILSLVWAFGKHGNINRRNFCRAQLIITAVVLVLYIIVVLIWGVSLAGALSTY